VGGILFEGGPHPTAAEVFLVAGGQAADQLPRSLKTDGLPELALLQQVHWPLQDQHQQQRSEAVNLECVVQPFQRLSIEYARVEAAINLFEFAPPDALLEEDEVEPAQTGEIECELASLEVDVVGSRDEGVELQALQEAVEKLERILHHQHLGSSISGDAFLPQHRLRQGEAIIILAFYD
jgi:hypothetical protein